MTGFKTGEPIDAERVRRGIATAFLKGIFEDIAVRVGDGENPPISIEVRERAMVGKIEIGGKYDVSARKIKEMFLLREGQAMRQDLIETAEQELRNGLQRCGFPEPEIATVTSIGDRPYRVNISLIVNTGNPLIIKTIKFSVVPPYSLLDMGDAVFSKVMRISPGDVYDQEKLEQSLKDLRAYFQKEGYYAPSVGPYRFQEGELEIVIDPGRRLTFRLEGNSALSSRRLDREIPFFVVGDFSDAIVQETIERILSLYHSEGYPFARIAPVINSDAVSIDITFFIFEGDRMQIGAFQFLNTSIPPQMLKGVISRKEKDNYNPDLLDGMRESLEELYQALGYLEAKVRDIEVKVDKEKKTVDIQIDIDEGRKTEIASVEITGADPALADKLGSIVNIVPGAPYNDIDIADARLRLLNFYSGLGYSHIDVVITQSVENYKVSITFHILQGDVKFMGKTVVTGNHGTRYEVIMRELTFREGDPYSFQSLAESRQKLYRLGLFTEVNMDAVDSGGDSRDILIRVREGNAGVADFGIGYAEYEKWRGYAQVSYRNLWGMNREGLLRTEISSLERRVIFQYNDPWFLGKHIPLRASFLHEKIQIINLPDRDTRYRLKRYAFTTGTELKRSGQLRGEILYEFSYVDTYDVQPDVVLSKEDTGTLAISSIRPSMMYDTRDNPFNPRKGTLATVSMKVASFLLLSETDFIKIEASVSRYIALTARTTLALSARGGLARNFGDAVELPLVERFFLGGRSTVRGYDQDELGPKGSDGNPTGGNAFVMGNIELRIAVGMGLGIVPFFDFGNVWLQVADIDPSEFKYTAGIGLRYDTPVGPLRVDFGFKLNKEPEDSRSVIHFSIGHAF